MEVCAQETRRETGGAGPAASGGPSGRKETASPGARRGRMEGGLREGPVPWARAARVSGPGRVLTGLTSERFDLLNLKQHQPF